MYGNIMIFKIHLLIYMCKLFEDYCMPPYLVTNDIIFRVPGETVMFAHKANNKYALLMQNCI